jgi:penicillin-binding protein 1A
VTASQLHHPLGGKTGTTNNFTDAWFVGFSPSVTCGTWIGFDDRQSLGDKETGARAALPMWIDFMRAAIANKPNEAFATAGTPKKELEVPVAATAPVARPKPRPETAPEDNSEAPGKPTPAPQKATGVSASRATSVPARPGALRSERGTD